MISDKIQIVEGFYWPINSTKTFSSVKETNNMCDILSPLCKNKNTMIQAGGNCGVTLKPFVSEFKNIYTFEPDAVNFLCMTLNLPYENVHKFQSCVGSKHMMVGMANDFAEDCGSHFVSTIGKIPVLKIDDLCLSDCDLIMLDIEGYEYQGLLGGVETITKYKPVLCLEFCVAWLERAGTNINEIENYLEKFGYKHTYSYETSYSTDRIYTVE